MKFFQANMQTGILVLLVVLVTIVCVALFFTNKEVRNIKAGIVKSRHDITAIQTLLNDVGLTASGGHFEDNDGLHDEKEGLPQTSFMGIPGMPSNVPIISPDMIPSELRPDSTMSSQNNIPEPVSSDTQSEPATLHLEKTTDQKEPDVIPPEDVEVINTEHKSHKPQEKSPVNPQKKPNQQQQEEESSSEDESDSDEDSESDDE